MATKNQPEMSGGDKAKWFLVALFLSAGIVANYQMAEVAWALRLAGWILLTAIVVAIGYQTAKGREIFVYAKEARVELRKVVWPTRQETVQSTIMVAVMVMITAVLLWAIDSTLLWIVSFFTG